MKFSKPTTVEQALAPFHKAMADLADVASFLSLIHI